MSALPCEETLDAAGEDHEVVMSEKEALILGMTKIVFGGFELLFH